MAKETAIYGLSSIIGRFLNWCLVPLYVWMFPTDEYGIVSYLYSFTAVALVILTYGMETGFFRFASKHDRPDTVYTTSLLSVASTSLLAIFLLSLFLQPVSAAIKLPGHTDYVWMLGVIVALDAFTNIPFAYLRYKKRALRFASIKMLNVALNIGLNLFFLLLCPWLCKHCPDLISWFYSIPGGDSYGIGWIFVANFISTVVVLLCLLPEMTSPRYSFDGALLRRMLRYSWPLLILGVAGIMSQNMGQMVIPYLFDDQKAAQSMVGIYGANIKIAIIMVMFTQAFRYAYEPFIFAQAGKSGEDKPQAFCDAMNSSSYSACSFSGSHVLPAGHKAVHISSILGRSRRSPCHDACRIMLRSSVQPVVVVQTYRPHRMGHVHVGRLLRRNARSKPAPSAGHRHTRRLHGFRMGRTDKLRPAHGRVMDSWAALLPPCPTSTNAWGHTHCWRPLCTLPEANSCCFQT